MTRKQARTTCGVWLAAPSCCLEHRVLLTISQPILHISLVFEIPVGESPSLYQNDGSHEIHLFKVILTFYFQSQRSWSCTVKAIGGKSFPLYLHELLSPPLVSRPIRHREYLLRLELPIPI